MNYSDWKYEDFLTYLYLHATHADFEESANEKKFIVSRVGDMEYDKVSKEFEAHSDYENAQVISTLSSRFCPTPEKKEALIADLVELFSVDSGFSDVEHAYFVALKRLL